MDATTRPRPVLSLLREAKGWSQSELAAAAYLSKATVSRIESGDLKLSEQTRRSLARSLGCPPGALAADVAIPEPGWSDCALRDAAVAALPARERRRLHATVQLTAFALDAPAPARSADPLLASAPRGRSARAVALALRARLELGLAPIPDLVGAVEEAGGRLVERRLPEGVAAVAIRRDPHAAPSIILNAGLPTWRRREALAHELGHLLLPRGEEQEAIRFADELLCPSEAVRAELRPPRITELRHLVGLARDWGVPVASLLRRAQELGELGRRRRLELEEAVRQHGLDLHQGDDDAERPRAADAARRARRVDPCAESRVA
ncbi:helix-turn-helix domain-containing protein [Agromyces mediolanus]|uniref:Transcriptional regulator n=1 Tax=Agromyces mediolanus TaxID=41986 RepID=A0A918F9N2_AGRME|nr:XRE family transcriptional regulator [Agromyces mediolanus]GGR13685.1 transcriptional regulator [Agromyces mediolanus]GLJ72684.1 transcriptional regulator [Agromyces mediolanus]